MSHESYDRIKKLGQGSFGAVYLVRDRRDNNKYVMKEIDLSTMGPQGRREALKEVGFLAKLSHPAIIGYREWFERVIPASGGKKMLHIVMEYADGGDLSSLIKSRRGRSIPEDQIVYYLVQLLLALLLMHAKHVMHRDLKAENVFLTRTNYVKLGDFGISKSLANTLAQARTRIGTPYYLSPEICLDRPYDTKNDMWALGVVLYQLCSLKHPFDASSMEGLLSAIVHTKHRALTSHYSKPLRDLIDALLQKKASRRPSVVQVIAMPWIAAKINDYLAGSHHSSAYTQAVRAAWAEAGAHHGGLALAKDPTEGPEEDVETQGVGVGEIAAGVQQQAPEQSHGHDHAHSAGQQGPSVVVTVNGQPEEFVSYGAARGHAQQFVPSARRSSGQNPSANGEISRRGHSGPGYSDEGPQLRPSVQQKQHQHQNAPSGDGSHVRAPYALPGSHYPETPQRLFHPDARPTPRHPEHRADHAPTPTEVRRAMGQFNRSGAGVAAALAGADPHQPSQPRYGSHASPGQRHPNPGHYESRSRQPQGYGSPGYGPSGHTPHSGSGSGHGRAGSAVPSVLPPIQRRGHSQGQGYEQPSRAYHVRPTQGYQSRNNSREDVKPTIPASQQSRYAPSRPAGAPRRPPPGVQRASKWK